MPHNHPKSYAVNAPVLSTAMPAVHAEPSTIILNELQLVEEIARIDDALARFGSGMGKYSLGFTDSHIQLIRDKLAARQKTAAAMLIEVIERRTKK